MFAKTPLGVRFPRHTSQRRLRKSWLCCRAYHLPQNAFYIFTIKPPFIYLFTTTNNVQIMLVVLVLVYHIFP
jgi:hypothetical protein